ncbi:hypothetical protein ACSBR1_000205 [Camellia fascicularis]
MPNRGQSEGFVTTEIKGLNLLFATWGLALLFCVHLFNTCLFCLTFQDSHPIYLGVVIGNSNFCLQILINRALTNGIWCDFVLKLQFVTMKDRVLASYKDAFDIGNLK